MSSSITEKPLFSINDFVLGYPFGIKTFPLISKMFAQYPSSLGTII